MYRQRTDMVHCSSFTMGRRMQTGTFIWVRAVPVHSSNCLKHASYIGHALNKIVKDIINRYQVIRGRRVKCVLH